MDIEGYTADKPTLMREIQEFLSSYKEDLPKIPNLSISVDSVTCDTQDDLREIALHYIESVLYGQNHVCLDSLLQKHQLPSYTNVCIPLLHRWKEGYHVDPLVILSHPEDVERICKTHIKKAPVFEKLLHSSIISTTDNEDWQEQRGLMNMAFIPKLSLQQVFPISRKRAETCVKIIKEMTEDYTKSLNMSDFFLHETMAQLQLSMFGFSEEFQEKTNKRLRNAFSGVNTEYLEEFVTDSLQEVKKATGPLRKLFGDPDLNKNIGNMLIYAFAGHDTTGHTLTWLLYELCKHPQHKVRLFKEIDTYWRNHPEPTYDTFTELPFMTQCITETLRLWPALANGTYRELETDETIRGHDGTDVTVPKGTYCQIPNWTRHRSSELWGSDVDVFNPDRTFQDSEIWNYEGFNTYTVSSERFSPFTYGPRNCIGKNFSQMEMRLILLYLLKHYDFQMTPKQQATIYNPQYKGLNGFTMGPGSIHMEDLGELYGMEMSVMRRNAKM